MSQAHTSSAAEQLFYDVMLDATADDPYTGYRKLRESAPALFLADGTLVLSDFEGCDQALRDRSLGKGDDLLGFQFTNVPEDQLQKVLGHLGASMVFRNPPDHTRLRTLVSSVFTHRHVQALRQAITARTDQLLDRFADHPGSDFMAEVATPLPLAVIVDLLGIPESGEEVAMTMAREFAVLVSPGADEEAIGRAVAAEAEFAAYITELQADKRRRPADDLLSRLATSHAEDTLTEEEMVSTALLLFVAGFETTTNLLGNGLHALLSHPDQFARLRADPSLIPVAVEELLRYDSPVQVDARTVLEPTALSGTELEPGRLVVTLLGAANHDPDRFTDPDRLDTARTDATHLAFASGIHFCLGAHLSRLETTVFFDRLLTRYPSIEQTAPPERRPGLALRGFAAFPLTLEGSR